MRSNVRSKRRRKESFGSKVFDAFNILIMIFILVVVLYPVLNIIAISFSSVAHISKADISIWPKGFNVNSYYLVLRDKFVYTGYVNSILYAAGSTLLMLLFTSMMAYALMVQEFVFKKFINIYLTITMFFGGGLIPTYIMMQRLKLLDTPWVMIIPGCVGAYNVFVFRTFFRNVPGEMRESALVDGANDMLILFKIILPLSKSLLATFALFSIVGSWNSWFNALIYLKDENKYPLQLVLRNYLYVIDANALARRSGSSASAVNSMMANMKVTPKGVRMAMIVITMFPIMMVYPFFQKYFVKGVMIGAIKG